MKKLVLFVALIAMSAGAFAQTSAGSLYAGGGLNFSTTTGNTQGNGATVDKPVQTQIGISPNVGYFISDNLAVGASIGVNYSGTNNKANNNKTKTTSFNVGPFARMYFPMGDNFYAYGQASVGVGFGNSKAIGGNTTVTVNKMSSVYFSVTPGVTFFPSEKVGIDFGLRLLSFNHTQNTDPQNNVDDNTNNFQFGFNTFSPSIGINYYF